MRSYTQAVRWVRGVTSWHVGSVEVARRNALVASTALAQRRQELRDVEDFLATHRARWDAGRRATAATRTA